MNINNMKLVTVATAIGTQLRVHGVVQHSLFQYCNLQISDTQKSKTTLG